MINDNWESARQLKCGFTGPRLKEKGLLFFLSLVPKSVFTKTMKMGKF